MTWVLWLASPVVATVLVALWCWVRARPASRPTTKQAMRAHGVYLDTLVETARSKDRGPARSASRDDQR